MGITGSLTLEKLKQITENIRVLEMVLSTKHLFSLKQYSKEKASNLPDNWQLQIIKSGKPSLGNFPSPGGRPEKIKAKKYFHKDGYQVHGVVIHDFENLSKEKLEV